MPVAIWLAYGRAGGYGHGRTGVFFLCGGIGLGQLSSTSLQLLVLCRGDVWGDAARAARERIHGDDDSDRGKSRDGSGRGDSSEGEVELQSLVMEEGTGSVRN